MRGSGSDGAQGVKKIGEALEGVLMLSLHFWGHCRRPRFKGDLSGPLFLLPPTQEGEYFHRDWSRDVASCLQLGHR